MLEEGDRGPADGELLSAHDLAIDESMLTGESLPVEKAPGAKLYGGTVTLFAHQLPSMGIEVRFAKNDSAAELEKLGRNPKMPWKMQSPLVPINANCDWISDDGAEVARVLAARGIRHVLLVGHSGHPEVVGTMGQLPKGSITLVEDVEQIEALEAKLVRCGAEIRRERV